MTSQKSVQMGLSRLKHERVKIFVETLGDDYSPIGTLAGIHNMKTVPEAL